MKLYGFEDVGESLERIPLSARRALDVAGFRVSLAQWEARSGPERSALVRLGQVGPVDIAAVQQLVKPWGAESICPTAFLDPTQPPTNLVQAFAASGSLRAAVWTALTDLDRYALSKTVERVEARRGQSELTELEARARLDRVYREVVGHTEVSTHLRAQGGVQMVNVGAKRVTTRRAEAETSVSMSAQAFEMLEKRRVPKGDVLSTANIAGIMAAKRTADLVPLCHPLALSQVSIDLTLQPAHLQVRIVSRVETTGKTGVEMEALVAASVAALTVYDMLKGTDRAMEIGPTRLVAKSGGASGDFQA